MRKRPCNLAEYLYEDDVSWSFQVTPLGVVEAAGDICFLYGHWRRLFGCWQVGPGAPEPREFVPDWPIVGVAGVWLSAEDLSCTGKRGAGTPRSAAWSYQANAVFAGLFSQIPTHLRRLVADSGPLQWLLLDMIQQVPLFARFLDDEIARIGPHDLFACLRFANVAHLDREARRLLAEQIMHKNYPRRCRRSRTTLSATSAN